MKKIGGERFLQELSLLRGGGGRKLFMHFAGHQVSDFKAKMHQRCLAHDSEVVKFISDYCIKYGCSNSCIGNNVMFCMQRYKCSVEMVFSGQMNNIIECDFIRSTDCVCMMH